MKLRCYHMVIVGLVVMVCVMSSIKWTSGDITEEVLRNLDSADVARTILKSRKTSTFDYKAAVKVLNEAKVAPNDPRLVQLIRDYYLEAPSNEEYHLKTPSVRDTSVGQVGYVDKQLNYMTSGFFIECGAFDGETLSNTLYFERYRRWTGLLIEPDPNRYQQLRDKKRKSFSINACLSTSSYPSELTFNPAGLRGRLKNDEDQAAWIERQRIAGRTFTVQCFPLLSILLALGQTNVDYFSLDVEGDELKVLKTLPLDQVNVTLMSVEIDHLQGGERVLTEHLKQSGYKNIMFMKAPLIGDVFYRKKV